MVLLVYMSNSMIDSLLFSHVPITSISMTINMRMLSSSCKEVVSDLLLHNLESFFMMFMM